MLILSIILILAGAASVITGIIQNNSIELQLESLLSSGSADPGTVWIVAGIIALVIGIVLLILHFVRKQKS